MEIRLTKIVDPHFDGSYDLTGASIADDLKIKKLKQNQTYVFKVVHERNHKHNAKLHALLDLALENQEFYKNKEDLREAMIMKAGYVKVTIFRDGTIHRKAQSISFDNMSQDKFETLYRDVIMAVAEEIGADVPQLIEEVEMLTQ